MNAEIPTQRIRSAPGDVAALRSEAAAEILDEDLCLNTGFYTPPARRLARVLHVSGTRVPDMIRSAGSLIEGNGGSGIAFVDIVGAGVEPCPWLAMVSDDSERLGRLLRRNGREEGVNATRGCERTAVFATVQKALVQAERHWRSLVEQSAAKGKVCPPPGSLVVCRAEDLSNFTQLPAGCLLVALPCESLFVCAMATLWEVRAFFGEGWCQGIGQFRTGLEGARKKTAKAPGVVSEGAKNAAGKAATTNLEMVGMGWNSRGFAENGELRRGAGIHVFREVELLDFWRGELPFRDRRRLCLAGAQSFESTHAQDGVLVGFKRLRYDSNDEGGWYLFPCFPHRGFHAIMRLLRGLRMTVIAYEAGHSRTSEAGVLESMLRRQALGKDTEWTGAVGPHIDRLLEGEPLLKKSVAPLDACDAMVISDNGARPNVNNGGSLGAAFSLLWKMIAKVAVSPEIIDLRRVAVDVLGVPASVPDHLAKVMPGAGPSDALAAHRFVDHAVGGLDRQAEPPRRRNRERYSVATLVQQFLHLIGAAYGGRLAVPRILSEWAAKRFRFVAFIPLDSPSPRRRRGLLPGRVAVGDWGSWQVYSRLFSTEAGPWRIRVDLNQLRNGVRRALSKTGWLTNKISETNELVVSLMRQHDYLPNFDLADLPRRRRITDRELVEALDGRLIVRCLQSLAGGPAMMRRWAQQHAAACRRLEETGSVPGKADFREYDATEFLSVFRDVEGLVAAAFDFVRETAGNEVPKIYFCFDLLRSVFAPASRVRSAARMGMEGDDFRPSEFEDEVDEIWSLLQVKDVPADKLMDALGQWEAVEGGAFEETAEDRLSDLEEEIDELLEEKWKIARFNLARLRKELGQVERKV
jgi:hypothetical protein